MRATATVLLALAAAASLSAAPTSAASEWWALLASLCGLLAAAIGLPRARQKPAFSRSLLRLFGGAGALIALALLLQAAALLGRALRYGGPSFRL